MFFQVSVCSWLEASLKTLHNSNNTHPTAAVTTKQLVEFHRAVTSAENAVDVSHAIREFVRFQFYINNPIINNF